MGEERVADLTLSQLKGLIAQVVDERLPNGQKQHLKKDGRSTQEILESIASNRIERLPGEPTLCEMIIEERNQWRQDM
ncbi:MAG: hypothetical protein F6J93_20630 [Oscillatoria sp. SIO1A7]|nr:hypothetical protein [Oscillatoria sp. SIO1A7]